MEITHPSIRRAGDISNKNTPINKSETYVVENATDNNPINLPEHPVNPVGTPEVIPSPVSTSSVNLANKAMLESLIFLGQIDKEVEIGDFKFNVTTLTHREHNLLMQELYKFGDGVDLFTIRTLTLALAVKSVNNTPLEDLPLSDEEESRLETKFDKRLAIIDSLQMTVVEKLFDAYTELTEKSESSLDGEQIKN